MLIPVVLSGGSGTRLWPLSREHHPKQFLPLVGQETMLQDTVRRLEGLGPAKPIIVCHENHRFIVAEQMRQIGAEPAAIVLEPVGRNTAPAVAVAALATIRAALDLLPKSETKDAIFVETSLPVLGISPLVTAVLRLLVADRVERHIDLPLKTQFAIPVGLTMANQDQFGHAAFKVHCLRLPTHQAPVLRQP